MNLISISRTLADAVDALRFGPPVAYVYNPLRYARVSHEEYLRRFGRGRPEILFVGMNPGPWGMAQTGVPFGEVSLVRDWMGIDAPVGTPEAMHPKKPVLGFACPRREVSGLRLWNWARNLAGSPEEFFGRFFVTNYCPLLFLDEGGRNLTPDKFPRRESEPLFSVCDHALRQTAEHLKPRYVVGFGRFAGARIAQTLGETGIFTGSVSHPSPANPRANRGWEALIARELRALGISLA